MSEEGTVRYNIRIHIAMSPGFPILDSDNNDYALLGDKDGSSDPKNDTGTFYTGKGLNPQIRIDGRCQ